MQTKADLIEQRRCALQTELDGHKTQAERNKLGQFATPTILARDVMAYGLNVMPARMPVRFFDPAIGSGSFYAALLAVAGDRKIQSAQGFEIDPHYGLPAQDLWKAEQLEITLADFTKATPPAANSGKPTLLISNPPYVRHHHLDGEEKVRLQALSKKAANVRLSGLAGLYCHFMAIAHAWMADDGIAGWLIPSEFMEVNYGRQMKQYLLREVTLLHIHRFDPNDVQFDDALVSSAVVWFQKRKPAADHQVRFSYGGSLQAPAIERKISAADLAKTDKWTRFPREEVEVRHEGWRLSDLFAVKRGLATGDNKFFILDEAKVAELDLPAKFLRPILPSTRYVKADVIEADGKGFPLLDKRLFLIDCNEPEEVVQRDYPTLWAYLQTGIEKVAGGYLCQSRRFWYAQENRHASPIVCTYIGRSDHAGRPFRFILNRSKATATNVFLMLYPQPILAAKLAADPGLIRRLWAALNQIDAATLLGNGRVYGGGMHKMEPKELGNVPADALATIAGLAKKHANEQLELVEELAA